MGTPIATATVSGAGVSSPSIIYATISPVNLAAGKTYVIAIDEQSGGDIWVDDYVPTAAIGNLNPVFTNLVECYGAVGSYPSTTWTGGAIYDTPTMIFSLTTSSTGGSTSTGSTTSSGSTTGTSSGGGTSTGTTTSPTYAVSTSPTVTATAKSTIITASDPDTPLVYFMRDPATTGKIWSLGGYIGANGDYHTNAWITLAGNSTIKMPYNVPTMLEILPDVPAGLMFQTTNDKPTNYAYGVLDAAGNFRFSQQNDGSHCWGKGANANQSLNDICLARTSAGALEINTGTAGTYGTTKFTVGGNVLDASGITLAGAAQQPVCSATLAGKLWYSGHAKGAKDSVAICAADASDAFAWRPLF